MTSPDTTKKSDASKLSMREYAMALSLFYITFATYGNAQAFAVLTVEWLKEFPNSKSLILYVPNLSFALMSAAGIIDGILINRFGIYKIMILGCFLQTSCLFGSSFSPNAITLVIVLGFLLGIASCFSYLNSFILMGLRFGDIGKFFIALLSLAGPLSGLVFSNLIPVFIELYAWRGSMFILAAINLHMIPLCLFLLLSHQTKKKKQLKCEARTKEHLAEQNSIPAAKISLDFSVIKVPLFLAYVWAMIFTLYGSVMMYRLLPSFLHSKSLGLKDSAAIFSIYSIVSALPRKKKRFLVEYMDSYEATFSISGASIMATNLGLLITVLVERKRGQKGSS